MVTFITNEVPTAYVAVKKGRRKVYNNNKIYLDNGTEFEIELFNPLQVSVLAVISLNGKEINSNGLVIKPGQRVFLERHFDSPNKFKFETYEVSGNNDQVKFAIQNNGKVEIKFKKEKVNNYWTTTSNPILYNLNNNTGDTYLYNGTIPTHYHKNNLTGTLTVGSSSLNLTSSNSNLNVNGELNDVRVKSMETGRVEKGEKSDQEFNYVNIDFEYTYFHSISYQILPTSTKPMTTNEIKVYCGQCGTKSKKGDNFCRKCGNKL